MLNKTINRFFDLTKRNFRLYLELSVLIFLFILFFQPFEIQRFDLENVLLFFAGFGLIVIFTLLSSQYLFLNLLTDPDRDEPADGPLFALYYLCLVAISSLGFIFYIRYVGRGEITFGIVVKVVFICTSIPFAARLRRVIESYRSRINELADEICVTRAETETSAENYADEFVELISETGEGNFNVKISDIVFLKSADNYVEVGYMEDGVFDKKLIRNTLKNVESGLEKYGIFIRTHRTSIVNTIFVDKLEKKLGGYRLSIKETEETVPVSRRYLLSVKELR